MSYLKNKIKKIFRGKLRLFAIFFFFSLVFCSNYKVNAQTVNDVFTTDQPHELVETTVNGTCGAGQTGFTDSSGGLACCTKVADVLARCKADISSSITSCTVTKDLYLDETRFDECMYNVRYTEVSGENDGFIRFYPDYPKIVSKTCTGVTGDYCEGVTFGTATPGCIPYKTYSISTGIGGVFSSYCCKSKSSGSLGIQSDPNKCQEIATPSACNSDEVLAQGSTTLCCKKLSSGDLSNACAAQFPNETSPTCTNVGNYRDANGLFSGCAVDIKNTKTNEVKTISNIVSAPVDPDSDPTNPGGTPGNDGTTGNPDTTPIVPECIDGKCVCEKYAATLDASKKPSEQDSCEKCYAANKTEGRDLYQWTALGCINVSTQGLIVNILRIFYGIGTGLLVFRIVTAGLKLLNEPDNPGVMKDSREEITASIFAFIFGVMSVVILRFFGINVLGLTWLENLFPVIG